MTCQNGRYDLYELFEHIRPIIGIRPTSYIRILPQMQNLSQTGRDSFRSAAFKT